MSPVRRWMSIVAALLGITALLVGASTASAHTGFESSSPAQDDVVDEPVSSVVVTFTGDTQPVDDLVVALDGAGKLRAPSGVTTDDQRTFVATFDPPLAGGEIGIRWTVLGADGHPLEGAFSFTVTAPVPTTTPPTTAPSVTTESSADPVVTTTTAETVDDSSEPASEQAVAASSSTTTAAVDAPADAVTDGAAGPDSEVSDTQSLDDFLAVDAEPPGGGRRLAGRLLSIPAVAGAVGALAFLAWVHRGTSREITAVVTGIRIAGVVLAVGAAIHYLGSTASTGDSLATGWTGTPGRAMALRLVGAALLVLGLRSTTSNNFAPRSLSASVIEHPVDTARSRVSRRTGSARERWDPSSSKVALVGVALLVVSFWFDGHTVTRGWRPLHAVVNSVHFVAGSVWFGGVITLAALAWWRYRRGDDARVGELVVRFSSIAAVALVAVAAAGIVLAFMVLDGFGELTGTEWGKTLLLKTGAVALAASLGAYNHFRLRPALEARPDDATMRATLRSLLTAEAILLTFVAVVTSWLVAAAT